MENSSIESLPNTQKQSPECGLSKSKIKAKNSQKEMENVSFHIFSVFSAHSVSYLVGGKIDWGKIVRTLNACVMGSH